MLQATGIQFGVALAHGIIEHVPQCRYSRCDRNVVIQIEAAPDANDAGTLDADPTLAYALPGVPHHPEPCAYPRLRSDASRQCDERLCDDSLDPSGRGPASALGRLSGRNGALRHTA